MYNNGGGARQAASKIVQKGDKTINRCNTIQRFYKTVTGSNSHFNFERIKDKNWDIFANGEKDLVVALLLGSDRKEDHCITLYGQWIYDSNFDYALLLTKECLDMCCSAEDTHETYQSVGVARICVYEELMHYKKGISPKKRKRN